MKKAYLFSIFFIVGNTFALQGAAITFEKGDITKANTEAIVNAANPQLKNDDYGVSGAIFKAAGKDQLQAACNKIPIINGDIRCSVGDACITDSFNLQKQGIKYIIHAISPDCREIKDQERQDDLLIGAYKSAMTLAESKKLKSIAFPFLGTGLYACSKNRAALVAISAIRGYFNENKNSGIKEVRFVLFTDDDLRIFKNNSASKTQLMKAAREGKISLMKKLINQGESPNESIGVDLPHMGQSVLSIAIDGGHSEAVKLLLQFGASIEKYVSSGSSIASNLPILAYAVYKNVSSEIIGLLIEAIQKKDSKIINISWENNGYTALMIAAYYGNKDALLALLKAGADPRIINAKNNKTALDLARDQKKQESVDLLQNWINQNPPKLEFKYFTKTVTVEKGDITKAGTEAIVNAANPQLKDDGRGVSGAIFKAAGKDQLQAACDKFPIIKDNIRCAVGDVCVTDSFNLRKVGTNYIIHAVGPDCREGDNPKYTANFLNRAYQKSLEFVDSKKISSVAFPVLSSGLYNCPRAADFALDAIGTYLRNNSLKSGIKIVKIIVFSDEDYKTFEQIHQRQNTQ